MKVTIELKDEDYMRINEMPNAFYSLTSRVYEAIRNGEVVDDSKISIDTPDNK